MHRLLSLCLAIAMLGTVVLGLLSWRLSQGPLELAWLARRLEAAANSDGPTRVSIGGAALAWEGFQGGVDRPLEIRLRDITATDAAGEAVFAIPMAEISLSLRGLLLGRFEPRAIELRNAQLRAQRGADGAVTIDLGLPPDASPTTSSAPAASPGSSPGGAINALLGELAQPAASDLSAFRDNRFSQLRRVLITRSALTVVDHQLGANWRAETVDIDLRRRDGGGVDASADIALSMGGEHLHLDVRAALDAGARSGHATAHLRPVAPAALARLAPGLAALHLLDAPVSLAAKLDLGPALSIREGVLEATIGSGKIQAGASTIILRQGSAGFTLSADGAALRALRLELAPRAQGPSSVLEASGDLNWRDGTLQARGNIALDQAGFADLPLLWPPGVARNAREWVTTNITAGIAHHAQIAFALRANTDLSDLQLTAVKGSLEADELSVHWLRPVPPVTRVKARLEINDPDMLTIHTTTGRQILDGPRGEYASGLTTGAGTVRITGLAQRDQIAQIDIAFNGPVAETISLLRHPRLRLLDRSPFELKEPAGGLTSQISVTVPLENNLTLDDVTIRALARTEGLRLSGLVAGRDLEQGALELDVTTEAMKITGRAVIAAIPAQLTADLDFRQGGPSQVQQRISATARADALPLAAAAGLNLSGLASGPAAAQIAYTRRRDGTAELRIGGDLREAELRFDPLFWRKPPGQPARMEARLRIQRDRILGVDELAITGEGLSLRGRVEQVDGRLAMLRLDRAVLGRTDGQGSVLFQPDGSVSATMQGSVVDLAPRMIAPPAAPPTGPRQETTAERGWRVEARFTTALMAHDVKIDGFSLRAESTGGVVRRMRIAGQAGAGPMSLEIAPSAGTSGRRFTAQAEDAATLLRGMDIAANKLLGGRLSVEGTYDDRAADRPLVGTARIDDFRVLNAPAVTSVLQAMTFYGLVQMAQGPGLAITKLIAPFRMTDTELLLHDTRAFNPSLGVTIAGRIDRIREICDLNGTVVPAYFFNSLLGDLPLIGRLFAPESGGGLFAANYTLRGKLADPVVAVNPLSALTPGFLRGLFGGF